MDKQATVRVIQVGLGPIGRRMVERIVAHPSLQLVGAVDIDPRKVGADVGGVKVVGSLADCVDAKADVAVVTTSSSLARCEGTFVEACGMGLGVVSTCEELSYPWPPPPEGDPPPEGSSHPEGGSHSEGSATDQVARRIDQAAKQAGVAVLGTGVNPGFLMDLLPVVMTSVCQNVHAVRVERYQDAGKRRLPFQDKVGAGLTVEEFGYRVDAGRIRHVGLAESMRMIAARMGWHLTKTEDRIDPLIAHDPVDRPPHARIAPGHVKGVHQVGEGWINDPTHGPRKVIELIFHAEVGQAKPQDRIVIRGEPSVETVIPGGVHGDSATCSMAINTIRNVLAARPGLRTMIDIDPPGCWQG